MDEEVSKRYLVIIKIKNATATHLASVVPNLQKALSRISSFGPENAFRSEHGGIFGVFIRSNKTAKQITQEVQSPGDWLRGSPPFLSGDDAVFVLEIAGDVFATQGFLRAGTWLQRH